MSIKEQEKALLEEIKELRHDEAALISMVSSLEHPLYWLRKKVFGRMGEKDPPLDPNQLVPVLKGGNVLHGISRLEEKVRKSEGEITRTIKKQSVSLWILPHCL